MISKRLAAVKPSATIAVSQKARELLAAGKDVVVLSMGEPDFDTPEYINQAAVEAIANGKTRYTAVDGIAELKDQICQKFLSDNDLSYVPSQISVAPGGKAIIFNALLATLDPGDEVIIPAPCWVSYPEMTRLCGGVPKVVMCSSKDGFKMTPETLAKAITAKTKWLLINSPSNPTGACYSEDELRSLGEVLKSYPDILILTDDIYEKLVYDGRQFATIGSAVPELFDRTLTMNGMSKAFAMTGWRLGYAGGPEWLISAMRKVMSQSTSNPSSISQYAALSALKGSQAFLDDWCQVFEARRDLICTELNRLPELSCQKSEGAFYAFVDCQHLIGRSSPAGRQLRNDTDVVTSILDEVLVALVPGSAFHAPGYFRLSFAASHESLETAISRIENFCQNCGA